MVSNFEEMFGPEIGQGAQATVYAKGEYAVKLYREDYPKSNVFSEAFIMANLEQEGFPSPRIYEVLIADKRYGLRMDIVKGKSVSDMMAEKKDDPEGFKEILRSLTKLQWLPVYAGSILGSVPEVYTKLLENFIK